MYPIPANSACTSATQEPPSYTPDSRSQAQLEVMPPPSYSLVDIPLIIFSLKLTYSSVRMRSANLPDQLDVRSIENNLPLYLVNKCFFDNMTSTFSLADSFTNRTIVNATKDLRKSNHFVIQDESRMIPLKSTSIFRSVYEFTWKTRRFRWCFDEDDLCCSFLSVDPLGREVNRLVGGVSFTRRETQVGRLWMFQNDLLISAQFEPIFIITAALVMVEADRLRI
ncbi:hypothetical protein K493DRAFT_390992 [Basidiobolus meristosporus CBS 931.73]|uniref:Uncharacterized protein n=1 Tax=Basidiobolus meristosporus CBS 931.73 TaxID=1314790 RepID=A0A1Y1YRN5_9FUNG|nr:hypothetical protein K493DRAFT_390992 [Basidiobolus meristosporus CBS 931.73]|eukprot:ORY00692.1 hypothetical protein K493DRAFT_390992 [Basidiobolus meristosporus CBS 931.73]